MARPATYFGAVTNRFTSTNLPKNIELHTIQAVICYLGNISRDESDHRVLKKSQGRPYETSFNVFCNSFKQIFIRKSPKNIVMYTI